MARNPYRDSMEKWKNFQPRPRRSFFPLKEGEEKKWNFQRRESWEERKKVSNCSRTLANWIKICPARRSSIYWESCTGSRARVPFLSARSVENVDGGKKLFSVHGNYESWAAVGSRWSEGGLPTATALPTSSQPHLQPLKWRCCCRCTHAGIIVRGHLKTWPRANRDKIAISSAALLRCSRRTELSSPWIQEGIINPSRMDSSLLYRSNE